LGDVDQPGVETRAWVDGWFKFFHIHTHIRSRISFITVRSLSCPGIVKTEEKRKRRNKGKRVGVPISNPPAS
jgi:hypothetical protein